MTPEQFAKMLAGNPDLLASNGDLVRTASQPAATVTASPLEAKFAELWATLGGPPLAMEYTFHPKRRWRFDFAHVGAGVAVEVEGGTWGNGRHNRHVGYRDDCIKYNAAVRAGWRVFRLTSDMIDEANVQPIIDLIEQ